MYVDVLCNHVKALLIIEYPVALQEKYIAERRAIVILFSWQEAGLWHNTVVSLHESVPKNV